MDGWIKIHRKIMDNPIVRKPNYWAVWNYLLICANHKDKGFIIDNEKHLIKRGQLLTSKRKISDFFSISISSVHKILNYLEREHMIEQKSTSKYTVIEIKNYNSYQIDEQSDETKSVFTRSPRETNKNDKNERIERESTSTSDKAHKTVDYLLNIPLEDIQEIQKEVQVTHAQAIAKGKELFDYCAAHGKKYKNYRAFFNNAVRRDFSKVTSSPKPIFTGLEGFR